MGRKVGAEYTNEDTCQFTVWAPSAEKVEVVWKEEKEAEALEKDESGYWSKTIFGVKPGTLYKYRLDGQKEHPDPASRSQPDGVHSWSRTVDQHAHQWKDENWKGLATAQMIIYELHVGTFTPEGTFEAVIDKLDHLKELGVNTLEIMPISQFPGNRNWGYDGVYPYAAQHSYGGAEGLKKMIDACHQKGFAVLLDAVYNHMGPEGNYLSEFGPYFTSKYETPWGKAINFDDQYADEVRNFFLQNAIMWMEDYHFDGLRLDAIHEIIDLGARHFLKELSQKTDELEEKTGRKYTLIAESDLNDTKIINPYQKGGFGLEAQWVDDFHHSLHTVITGEKEGYYSDYGCLDKIAKSFKQAFVYDGTYSNFRKRTIGNSPKGLAPSKFVVCIQNHDQVGNRPLGDRLSQLISFEQQKLASGIFLMAPFVPMLFMGEEFAEDNPFQYFVSHGDPDLVKAVQEGRKREFQYFFEKSGEFPDPQSQDTFNHSKLNWNFREDETKSVIFEYYKELLQLRKNGAFNAFRKEDISIETDKEREMMQISGDRIYAVFNFKKEEQEVNLPKKKGDWKVVLASAAKKWLGPQEFQENYKSEDTVNLPASSLIICES
jgi:maltooligosyltrehalose trehalohydrolase